MSKIGSEDYYDLLSVSFGFFVDLSMLKRRGGADVADFYGKGMVALTQCLKTWRKFRRQHMTKETRDGYEESLRCRLLISENDVHFPVKPWTTEAQLVIAMYGDHGAAIQKVLEGLGYTREQPGYWSNLRDMSRNVAPEAEVIEFDFSTLE